MKRKLFIVLALAMLTLLCCAASALALEITGSVEVGDEGYTGPIGSGDTWTIESGGKLIIPCSTTLTIESGGTLNIESGGKLECGGEPLAAPGGTLDINGGELKGSVGALYQNGGNVYLADINSVDFEGAWDYQSGSIKVGGNQIGSLWSGIDETHGSDFWLGSNTMVLPRSVLVKKGDGNLTIVNALYVLSGGEVDVQGGALVIEEGKTLYLNGTIKLPSIDQLVIEGNLVLGPKGAITAGGKSTHRLSVSPSGVVVTGDAAGNGKDYIVVDAGTVTLDASKVARFLSWTISPEDDGVWIESGKTLTGTNIKKNYTITAEVSPPPPPTPLRVTPGTLELSVGESGQLSANKSGVAWSSSDEGVATVDETGLVTGVSEGEASITAKQGSQSASCKVNVLPEEPIPAVEGLAIDVLAIKKGNTMQPPIFTGYKGEWVIEDESVVKLTKKGNFKGVKLGSTVATYRVTSLTSKAIRLDDRLLTEGEQYHVTIHVRKAGELPSGVSLTPKKLTLDVGEAGAQADCQVKCNS